MVQYAIISKYNPPYKHLKEKYYYLIPCKTGFKKNNKSSWWTSYNGQVWWPKPLISGVWREWTYNNIIRIIHSKTIANVKINGEKFKIIPLKSEKTKSYPLSQCLFNTGLKVLAGAIRELMEINGIKMGNEEVKGSLFTEDM